MADVTGGAPPTGASPFRVPEDFQAAYDHFGGDGMFSVAVTADLPASGNWDGRILTVRDSGAVYRWKGSWRMIFGDTGWKSLGSLSSGWREVAGESAEYRVLSGLVMWRGRLDATSGAGSSPFTGPIPAEARPVGRSITATLLQTGGGTALSPSVVDASGVVTVFKPATLAGLSLDGFPRYSAL